MTLRGTAMRAASVLVLVGLLGRLAFGGALFGVAFLAGVLCLVVIWIVGGSARTRFPVADDLQRADADPEEREPPIVPTNLPGPS